MAFLFAAGSPAFALPSGVAVSSRRASVACLMGPKEFWAALPAKHVSFAEDFCELVTLEQYASAVFGKHYRMEAWVCPASEVAHAQLHHECLQVEHNGEMVWACSLDPKVTKPPAEWQGPASWRAEVALEEVASEISAAEDEEAAADEALFEKLKAALPQKVSQLGLKTKVGNLGKKAGEMSKKLFFK